MDKELYKPQGKVSRLLYEWKNGTLYIYMVIEMKKEIKSD